MHPRAAAGDPQPGLVEVRDRRRGELAHGHVSQERGQGRRWCGRSPLTRVPTDMPTPEQVSQRFAGPLDTAGAGSRPDRRRSPAPVARTATGAPTPAGPGAIVVVPHRHRRCCSRCSVTRNRHLRQVEDLPGLDRGHRRPPQRPATAATRPTAGELITSSGTATCRNVKPGSPGCLPGDRPEGSRRDRGGGLPGPSDDGGFDDVRESLRSNASSSATRAVNTAICASRSASQRVPLHHGTSNRASRSSSSTVEDEPDTRA